VVLASLGFSIRSFDRSSPGKDYYSTDLSTREYVDRWDKRFVTSDLTVPGTLSAGSRDDVLAALENLAAAVSPELGWCELQVADVSSRHLIAKGNGIKVSEEWPLFKRLFLPVEISFLRQDAFWYDNAPVTGSIPATVVNAGTVKVYPTWTAVVGGGGEPAGFSFKVGTQVFQYVSALSAGDVVVVYTDPATKKVELNGEPVSPNSMYEFVDFPYLDVGSSLCSKNGNVTISYEYYGRYLVGA